MALGNPQTAFYLHHQGRLVHSYAPGTRADRLDSVLRWEFKPMHLSEQTQGAQIDAFLSPPQLIQDRGELLLYINGRSVRNKSLLSAVRNTYLSTLGAHHEPTGVIFIELRKDWVDVNVHPQKLEVRLLRQEAIYQWLTASVRKALSSQTPASAPSFSLAPTPPPVSPSVPYSGGSCSFFVEAPSLPALSTETLPLGLHYLGNDGQRFLIARDSEGIVLFHRARLRETLVFEQLNATDQTRSEALSAVTLVVPKIVSLTPVPFSTLTESLPLFAELGFEIDIFGDGDAALKSRPRVLSEERAEAYLREAVSLLFESWADSSAPSSAKHRTKLVALLARRYTFGKDQPWEPASDLKLLSQLSRCDEQWLSPDGRRLVFRIRFQSLEKHFGIKE